MKKYIFVALLLCTAMVSANAGEKPNKIKFEHLEYDFGDVDFGSDISHEFIFKNKDRHEVGISGVTTTCGCTTPSYAQEPVKHGKKGSVFAKYDSTRIGDFNKTLTVSFSNGEAFVLIIKGNVRSPAPRAPQGK